MDHEIDKQDARSTEGGEVKCKVGDWVWVKGQIKNTKFGATETEVEICEQRVYVRIFDCRPVEPKAKEPTPAQKLAERTMKAIWAANDAANGTPVVEESLTTESNSPKIPDSSSDPINPSHYKQGGIECIEAIKAATGDGFIGYVWGNVLKYLWRWPKKGGVDDLKKARWYLDRLIKEVGE